MIDPIVLANITLEVAEYRPDFNTEIPRAQWRQETIEIASEIIRKFNITENTDDVDEIVQAHVLGLKG